MLHILLLILKIIGIIIAAILGILVLLVCVVLFVPVRYCVEGEASGNVKEAKAKIRVTWLLHLIRVDVRWEESKLFWKIRLAFKVIQSEEDEHEKETSKEESIVEELETAEIIEKSVPEEAKEESKLSERVEEEFQESPKTVEERETKAIPQLEESSEDDSEREQNAFQKIFEKIKNLYQNIKCTFRKICDRIKLLLEKKEKLEEFITDEIHMHAFLKAKDELFKLLRRLKPKKLKADICYGFEDPCLTGQVLAGLSVLYPFMNGCVSVVPDFENQLIEGNLFITGRIYVITFVKMLWNLVWCKDVRVTYRHIRNFKL